MCELLLLVVKNKVDKTEMDTPTTTETEQKSHENMGQSKVAKQQVLSFPEFKKLEFPSYT